MAVNGQDLDLHAVFGAAPTAESWLVILPVVLCLSAGAGLAAIRGRISLHAPLAIAALALLLVLDLLLLARVATLGPLTMVLGRWLPPFGIAFSVDVLGALFAATSALVALGAAIHALSDTDRNARRYGFYPMLLFLMAGVSGAFLTGDIFNLYVWFEVLLIASFGLLVLGGEPGQIDGAVKYGLLNLVGTTLFLIATGYLYALFGTLNMADLTLKFAAAPAGLPLVTLAVLYAAAFAMKAAVFPLNFWLATSYHTPRITVGALFAGLLTKVGIYAMLRVLVMLMPMSREAIAPLIGAAAMLTMLVGALGAIAQSDLRKLAGQLVISGIGVMLAGVALGDRAALAGTILYGLHSMLVMTAIYLMAGLAARQAGSYRLDRMAGLGAAAPRLAAAALLLFLAAAGLPPMSGLWPKVMLVESALGQGAWGIAVSILVAALLTSIAVMRTFLIIFWRPGTLPAIAPQARAGAAPFAVVALLTALSLAVGLWPEPFVQLARAAADGLADPAAYLHSVFPEPAP